eukprot:781414_1
MILMGKQHLAYTKSKRQQSEATMHHVVNYKVQSIGIPPTDAPPANDSHKSKQSNLLSPDVDSMGWSQLKERCGMEGLSTLGTKKQLLFSLRQKLYPNKDNDSDSNGLEKKKKNKKGSQTGALKQEKSANKLKPALSKQVKRSTASDTDQSEDEEDDATESESNASDGAHHTPIDATNDRSLSHISNSSDNDGDDNPTHKAPSSTDHSSRKQILSHISTAITTQPIDTQTTQKGVDT